MNQNRFKKKLFQGVLHFLLMWGLSLLLPRSIHALSLSVKIPEEHVEVVAGKRAYFSVEIKYPENNMRKDLRLEYQIKKDDQIVAESKVLKAVETQISFMDYVVVPDSSKKGLYTISVKITDYEDLSEEVSTTFEVITKEKTHQQFVYVILIAIVILGVVISLQIQSLRQLFKHSK